jgi:tetratricopeptide (TPR) repeat protein
MSHLGKDALKKILAGQGGIQEAETAAEHLVACPYCRTQAREFWLVHPELQGEGPLKLVFDLIDKERQWSMEVLAAGMEWIELRQLSRRSQRDRVRMSKACHTLAFFNLVLGELKETASGEEAEFITSLAVLSVDAMDRNNLIRVSTNDLKAEVWTAVANARRRTADWRRAQQALDNAERYLKAGTGDSYLEAGLLSIKASTLADQGQADEALEALERCRAIHEGRSEWNLVARALVQMTHILQPIEPDRALQTLDRAFPLIPSADSYLMLFAEMLRVECLIELGKPHEAMHLFQQVSPLLLSTPKIQTRIRGKFTNARLLDALGHRQQAERLFNEVVNRDIEHELYKDAFLDLLYLYERHVKAGDLEKAARVCRKALTDPTLAEAAHDQMRDLWMQLLEAAQRQAISQDLLRELRRYFCVHWKHPAAIPPSVAFR